MRDDDLAQECRVVLRLSHVQVHRRQDSPVLLPPATRAIGRHRRQGFDQRLVRAGVVGCEATYAFDAHARDSGLDLAHLDRVGSE